MTHEFHPDDESAIVTEPLSYAHIQGASLTTEPDGSFSLRLHVPVPGTNRYMEVTMALEPFLVGTLRTVAYPGATQLDVELELKGVCRKVDKDLYTVRIM